MTMCHHSSDQVSRVQFPEAKTLALDRLLKGQRPVVVLHYNSMTFLNLKTKNNDCKTCFSIYKIPPLPLRGMVGQLRNRKRVFCWSIYIICLWMEEKINKRRKIKELLILLGTDSIMNYICKTLSTMKHVITNNLYIVCLSSS